MLTTQVLDMACYHHRLTGLKYWHVVGVDILTVDLVNHSIILWHRRSQGWVAIKVISQGVGITL